MNLPTPLQEAYKAQNSNATKNTAGGDAHVSSRKSDKLARKTAKKVAKLAKKQARADAATLKSVKNSAKKQDKENKRISKEQSRAYKQDRENEKKAAREQDNENKRISKAADIENKRVTKEQEHAAANSKKQAEQAAKQQAVENERATKEHYTKQQARGIEETLKKEISIHNQNNTLLALQQDTSIENIVKVSDKTKTSGRDEIANNYPNVQIPRSKKDLIKLVVELSDANKELRASLTTNTLTDPGRAAGVLLAQAAHAAEQIRQDAERECSAMVTKAAQETEQILSDVRDKVSGAMLDACRQAVESINKIKRS